MAQTLVQVTAIGPHYTEGRFGSLTHSNSIQSRRESIHVGDEAVWARLVQRHGCFWSCGASRWHGCGRLWRKRFEQTEAVITGHTGHTTQPLVGNGILWMLSVHSVGYKLKLCRTTVSVSVQQIFVWNQEVFRWSGCYGGFHVCGCEST